MAITIPQSRWATRFIWASLGQGLLTTIWTAVIVLPILTPAPSRIIAAGSAGTWLFVGYSMYLVVGVLAVALTALFYFYLEGLLRRPYRGITNVLAWIHLILMNVGVIGATGLLMSAGYRGGAALLPSNAGGGGLNVGQVHTQIMQYYPEPIAAFLGLLAVGVLAGGLGYVLAYAQRPAVHPAVATSQPQAVEIPA